jgi:hypothetical protein
MYDCMGNSLLPRHISLGNCLGNCLGSNRDLREAHCYGTTSHSSGDR